MRLLLFSLATSIAFIIACSGEGDATIEAPPADPEAHCDAIIGMSTCVDYMSRLDADAGCGSFEGVVADGACPAESRTGRCQTDDGNIRNYYESGEMPNDAAYAAQHCENAMGGTVLD